MDDKQYRAYVQDTLAEANRTYPHDAERWQMFVYIALSANAIVKPTEAEIEEARKGFDASTAADYRGVRTGPLCRQALDYCRAPAFQVFMHEHHGARGCTQHYAAVRLKEIIGRPSRKAIDHDPEPRQRFLVLQGEYRRWLQQQEQQR